MISKNMEQNKENVCNYCKWASMHTCTGRSCQEAIAAAEKRRNESMVEKNVHILGSIHV